MTPEQYKSLINAKQEMIYRLQSQIDELADEAMEEQGTKIPYVSSLTGETSDDLFDDAQWFTIKSLWDCSKSPFGLCMYHKTHDRSMDSCVFCGEPYERK